jgi:hypothetical protein
MTGFVCFSCVLFYGNHQNYFGFLLVINKFVPQPTICPLFIYLFIYLFVYLFIDLFSDVFFHSRESATYNITGQSSVGDVSGVRGLECDIKLYVRPL